MKRPLAYISTAVTGDAASAFCRTVYEAGFSPICPSLYLPDFLNDAVPGEHKDGIDIARDLLRRSHVLVVCGKSVDETMMNEIAIAQRLHITATTLDGILVVQGQGRSARKETKKRV
jgi:hypothetical protein